MTNDSGSGTTGDDVNVVTTATGPDRYSIVATATIDCTPGEVWELLQNWERLVDVGLPGMTENFVWLTGGPGRAPSTFQFDVGGATLKEEIYELTEVDGLHRLRYRALEPALGVLEYDAVLELAPAKGSGTAFSAERQVRLEPGTPPDMLTGMVEAETKCLKEHFAA